MVPTVPRQRGLLVVGFHPAAQLFCFCLRHSIADVVDIVAEVVGNVVPVVFHQILSGEEPSLIVEGMMQERNVTEGGTDLIKSKPIIDRYTAV